MADLVGNYARADNSIDSVSQQLDRPAYADVIRPGSRGRLCPP